jgi:phosphotransferase system HPr (HPr) family protein
MPELKIAITHEVGLHARPAAEFVKVAAGFPCEIKVQNLTAASEKVNAKSILGILTLGVSQGHEILIETVGDQAQEALDALKVLIESNFGE